MVGDEAVHEGMEAVVPRRNDCGLLATGVYDADQGVVALELLQGPHHLVDERGIDLLVELLQRVSEQVVQGCDQEGVLVVDVPVDRVGGDVRGLGDACHRGLLEPSLAEEPCRRRHYLAQLLVAVLGSSVARHTQTLS